MNRKQENRARDDEPQAKEPVTILDAGDGPRVYTPEKMMALLGYGRDTYYKVRKLGLLKFSRLFPGGPAVHTQQQYDDYIAYLNSQNERKEGLKRKQ